MLTRGLRRWLIVGASLVLLLCAYAAFGFWGVPRLLRSNLEGFVSSHYHRHLGVGDIRFNPFTLTLEVRSLSFPDADGQPMLGFNRLFVNVGTVSIWRRAPSFQEITLDGPFARVLIHPDGTLNLADLSKAFPPGPKPTEPTKPARLFIDRLSVHSGRTVFEDHSKPDPFTAELQPISFELRDFSTTGKTGNAYSLAGASEAGERFRWDGTLEVTPVSSKGHFEVDNLLAHTLWSYARDSLGFEIPSGMIALAGDYAFTTAGAPIGLTVDVHNLTVTNLGLRARGKDADYVDLARIEVSDTRLDLEKKSVQVGKVKLAGGDVRAWRDAHGAINLMELAAKPTGAGASTARAAPQGAGAPPTSASDGPAAGVAGAATAPAAAAPPAWSVSVPDIAIEGFKISAEDRQVSPTVAVNLDPLNIHVAGFTTAPNAKFDVDADTSINKTGKLHAKASISPDSGAVSAQTKLEGFDLTLLQPYIAQQTSMTLLSGQFGTSLAIERAANGGLSVTGDTEVAKLRTIDNALQKDFIKWDLVRASGIDFNLKPVKLKIARVDARGAYARVIIAQNQKLNVTEVLTAPGAQPPADIPAGAPAPAAATAAAAAAPEAAPAHVSRAKGKGKAAKSKASAPTPAAAEPGMPLSIGLVSISDSSAHFADFSIQPNYAVAIQSLNGSIAGMSSDPKSRAKLKLEGKVDRYAPVNIDGEINLLAATAYTNIKMSFKGVDMSSVTPYSGHFAGYKIEKGKLTADLSYLVEDRKLTADHHIVIDQLQLGDKVESPDAMHLPLKLAVALLKDRNGVIDLGLPVTGSLDDPQFKIGPLIWKVVVGLLTKAVTAPFALLGRLFGGGEEMNLVDFKPGSAALEDAGHQRMESLIKAMKERPQLELDVPMGYSAELDKPALAQKELQDKLVTLKQKETTGKKQPAGGTNPIDASVLADPAEHYRLLAAEYRAELGKEAALPDSAVAVEEARKKKAPPPAFDPAIADLQGALIARTEVSDSALDELGKRRAHSIQEALLGGGEIEASRVFLLDKSPKADDAKGADGKPPPKDVVRLELSLK